MTTMTILQPWQVVRVNDYWNHSMKPCRRLRSCFLLRHRRRCHHYSCFGRTSSSTTRRTTS